MSLSGMHDTYSLLHDYLRARGHGRRGRGTRMRAVGGGEEHCW